MRMNYDAHVNIDANAIANANANCIHEKLKVNILKDECRKLDLTAILYSASLFLFLFLVQSTISADSHLL